MTDQAHISSRTDAFASAVTAFAAGRISRAELIAIGRPLSSHGNSMPVDVCRRLRLPPGSSYATGLRHLKKLADSIQATSNVAELPVRLPRQKITPEPAVTDVPRRDIVAAAIETAIADAAIDPRTGALRRVHAEVQNSLISVMARRAAEAGELETARDLARWLEGFETTFKRALFIYATEQAG